LPHPFGPTSAPLLARLDVERHVGKERMVECDGKVARFDEAPATVAPRVGFDEGERHATVRMFVLGQGLVFFAQFADHFFAGVVRRHVSVGEHRLHDAFLPLDFRRQAIQRLAQKDVPLMFLTARRGEVASIGRKAMVFQFENPTAERIQKPSVVRDDDQRRMARQQVILQPFHAVEIEMVRRFVQQQDVARFQEQASERDAHAFPARQRVVRLMHLSFREPQTRQMPRQTRRVIVGALHFPSREQTAVFGDERIQTLTLCAIHRPFEIAHLALHIRKPRVLEDGVSAVIVGQRALFEARDEDRLRTLHRPRVGRHRPFDQPQQRRLARTVVADEPDPVAAIDRKRHVLEDGTPLKGFGCAMGGDDAHESGLLRFAILPCVATSS
jgi:hypothetical protein